MESGSTPEVKILSSSKKRKSQKKRAKLVVEEVQISDTDMTFGKIKVSSLAIALGVGLITLTQYLVITAAIIVSIILVLLMIPFVGFMKTYYTKAQRKLKQEHIPTMQKHVGFNTFFSNREVVVYDIVFIASIILFIIALIFWWTSIWFWAAIRVAFVYTFFVHCFYNSKVYNALQRYENITQGG